MKLTLKHYFRGVKEMKLCFDKFYLFFSSLIILFVDGFIALTPNEHLISIDANT